MATMPGAIRAMNKDQIANHGVQKFGVQLEGSKNEMLHQLEELYLDLSEEDAAVTENSDNQKTFPAAAKDAFYDPYADVDRPDGLELLPVKKSTIRVGNKEVPTWPRTVQWLYNPATGTKFPATPALLRRLDLIPCSPPNGEYRGY